MKSGIEPGEEAGDFLRHVDWARTRAYAIGLSGIYLNLKGREAQGIVLPEEAGSVKAAIAQGLSGLVDPERGEPDCHPARAGRVRRSIAVPTSTKHLTCWSISRRDTGSRGRRRWEASPRSQLEDNTKKWSGDHIIDPDRVPGVLFMNRPFRGEGARLLDLAPSILAALGVPKGPAMEGESLLS